MAFKHDDCTFVTVIKLAFCPKCKKQNPNWVEWKPSALQTASVEPSSKGTSNVSEYDGLLDELKLKLNQAIATDPVANKIQLIIHGKLESGEQKDARQILEIFVFLSGNADALINAVKGKGVKAKQDLAEALKREFWGREIIPGDTDILFQNDDLLAAHFRQAWFEVGAKWPQDEGDQVKFVKDIFPSTKGYAKTAREIEDWTPPSEVDFGALIRSWLNSFANDSVFTGVNVSAEARERKTEPQPGTRKAQIKAWYETDTKDDEKYNHMWGLILIAIGNAYGLTVGQAEHKSVLLKLVSEHQTDLKQAFNQVLAAEEIEQFLKRSDEVYDSTFKV